MKMVPVMQRVWLQMSEPKWCISMGACASSGGVFDTYAVVQGIDRFIPVDVYVPGCPPRPEQLIRAVLDLQEKVQSTGTINAREFAKRTEFEGPAPLVKELPADKLVIAPGNFRTGARVQSLPMAR
jgi:NADH-quinone oxidoreductase subunit B